MTDAEKYARIFRAAADGVQFDPLRYDISPAQAQVKAMHDAFAGVARMFEKIVEAEKLP